MNDFPLCAVDAFLLGMCWGEYSVRQEYDDVEEPPRFAKVAADTLKPYVATRRRSREVAISVDQLPSDVEWAPSCYGHLGKIGKSPSEPHVMFRDNREASFRKKDGDVATEESPLVRIEWVQSECSLVDSLNEYLGEKIGRTLADRGDLFPLAGEPLGTVSVDAEIAWWARIAREDCGEEVQEDVPDRSDDREGIESALCVWVDLNGYLEVFLLGSLFGALRGCISLVQRLMLPPSPRPESWYGSLNDLDGEWKATIDAVRNHRAMSQFHRLQWFLVGEGGESPFVFERVRRHPVSKELFEEIDVAASTSGLTAAAHGVGVCVGEVLNYLDQEAC